MIDGTHQRLVLRDRRCPADQYGYLVARIDCATGRPFLWCDEVDDTWWHPDDLDGPQAELVERALIYETRDATVDELRAAGWPLERFEVHRIDGRERAVGDLGQGD